MNPGARRTTAVAWSSKSRSCCCCVGSTVRTLMSATNLFCLEIVVMRRWTLAISSQFGQNSTLADQCPDLSCRAYHTSPLRALRGGGEAGHRRIRLRSEFPANHGSELPHCGIALARLKPNPLRCPDVTPLFLPRLGRCQDGFGRLPGRQAIRKSPGQCMDATTSIILLWQAMSSMVKPSCCITCRATISARKA